MKKVFILLVLAIAIPACVFAGSGVFGLSVGATAAYQKPIFTTEDGKTNADVDLEKLSISDFKFGADVDVKLLFLDVNAKGYYQPAGDDSPASINGIVSANLAVDLVIVRLKAGLGYAYGYAIGTEDGFKFGNNKVDNLAKANLDVHVGVDVLLGDLIIGAYGTLGTNTNIEDGNWTDLISSVKDNWTKACFGVSVGFSLI